MVQGDHKSNILQGKLEEHSRLREACFGGRSFQVASNLKSRRVAPQGNFVPLLKPRA